MSVFQLPRNLKAKALKMIVQKTILSFWVCVSHDVTPKSLFFVKVQSQVGDISCFNPFITPLASHELQEHGDIPWQPQRHPGSEWRIIYPVESSWNMPMELKSDMPGMSKNSVLLHLPKCFVPNRFWGRMWATLMPAVKKWAHTCLGSFRGGYHVQSCTESIPVLLD